MTAPKRIQQRRTKGWRLPLNAKSVARPSKWGNRWRVVRADGTWDVLPPGDEPRLVRIHKADAIALAVQLHREWLESIVDREPGTLDVWPQGIHGLIRTELRGRDLACWCPIGTPCHGDTLLELANGDPS